MAMPQQPVTDAQLVDALAREHLNLTPPPSQSFTVHHLYNFNHDPSYLYDWYGPDPSGCVYFFCDQLACDGGWKVVAGSQPVLDADGGGVGWKDTLVFHEGRWLQRTRWAMDEFHAPSTLMIHESEDFSAAAGQEPGRLEDAYTSPK